MHCFCTPRPIDKSHLDTELAFWLFLLDQGSEKRDWFTSWEYRVWSLSRSNLSYTLTCFQFLLPGCVVAILGMPITTLVARHNILTVRTCSLVLSISLF